MVAQELALAIPRARRPARPRLHDARRAEGAPDAAGQRSRLMAEAATLEPAVALRRFVENALAPATVAAHPELVDRIMAHRLATAQQPAAWAAQAAAGATFDAYDRLGALAAPTLVQHGDEDVVVDPRNADLLVELLPDARLERVPGHGPPLLLGGARAVRLVGLGVPGGRVSRQRADDRALARRPRAPHARPRRDPLPRQRADLRRARPPRDAARGRARGARPAPRRPARDADADVAGPRRDALRLRAPRRRAPADLVAPRSGRDRVPARGRRAHAPPRLGGPRGARAGGGHGRRDRADRRPDARDRRRRRGRRARRRPAAPRLHVGDDRQAEGRAPHPRELLLDEPVVRPDDEPARRRRRPPGAAAVPRRRLERAAAARVVEGRDGGARAVVRRGARARADRRARGHDDDGRPRDVSVPVRAGGLRDARISRACGSRSSAARPCPSRCSRRGRRAGSRSSRATA